MYSNNEYEDDDQEQEQSSNFLTNFYNNNKVLVWIFCGIILFIIIMSLLTKGGSNTTKEEVSYDVTIYPEEGATVSIGTSTNYVASVKNNPQAEIVWTVEDDTIAKVDNGNVTGLDYGKTKVIATYIDPDNNKHSADREITVADGDPTLTLTDVAFKDGDLFMPLNSTYKIALTLTPSRGYIESKEFTSSNTNIVRVDNTGLVTSTGEGEAIITFDVNNGKFRKDLRVFVDSSYKKTEIIITPEKISFDGELRKIKVGTTEKLTYSTTPENVDRTKLVWESSDTSIVTVDENGRIKGLREGTAKVTLSSINGTQDQIDVEVESDVVDVTDINLSITDLYLTVGQSQTITPVVSPDNASNKALSYVSMDSTIAAVGANETGTQATITAISVGSTTISVKSSNGIEKRINVTVTGSSNPTNTPAPDPTGGTPTNQGFTISSKDANNEGYINTSYELTEPRNNGATAPVKITVTKKDQNSGKLKVVVCSYPADSSCNENASNAITITTTDTFTMNNLGAYVIRVYEYNSNNTLISTIDKYIWIKATTGSASPTPSGNLYTISGKVYDTEAAAKLDPYTDSGAISFNVNSSVGYIMACWANGSTNCNPTKKITSIDTASFNQVGTWVLNIKEVYNNGSTKTVKKYVYVKSSAGGPVTACQNIGRADECRNAGCYWDYGNGGRCLTSQPVMTPTPTPKPAVTATPTPDTSLKTINMSATKNKVNSGISLKITSNPTFDYVYMCITSMNGTGCSQTKVKDIVKDATLINSYFNPGAFDQFFDPCNIGTEKWVKVTRWGNTDYYNVKLGNNQKLYFFVAKTSGNTLTAYSNFMYATVN